MKICTIVTAAITSVALMQVSISAAYAETMSGSIKSKITRQAAPPSAQSLRLLAPNGGEKIAMGSNYRIRWMAKGARGKASIRLMQGKRTVGTIAGTINVAAGSYVWRVGSVLRNRVTAASDYRIVIMSADGRLSDMSNGYFSVSGATVGKSRQVREPRVTRRSVTPSPSIRRPGVKVPEQQGGAPFITIATPRQYEGWCTDSTHTITWDTNIAASTFVKIELVQSDAAGTLWRTVADSTPNDGSFDWEGISSADYNANPRGLKVRISTLDNSVVATGDYFTFGKQLYFDKPNSGMSWRQGAQGRIEWKKICTLPGPVDIDLLDSNHQFVRSIQSNLSPIPRNSSNKIEIYNWPITTAVDPGSYYVRLSSGSISMERAVTINEEIVFPKSPHFTITSPQQFSGWCTDSPHTITWNSDLPSNTPVKIELTGTDVAGIVTWRLLAASTPNDGSFEWEGINSADYNSVSRRLRVRMSTLDDAHVTIGDLFNFGKPLYFEEPSAPYTWSHGSTGTIRWEKVCTQPSPITLDLLDSNHQFVLTIASGLSPLPRLSSNQDELYGWQVPSTVPPGSYFIRLSTGSISMEKPINIGN